MSGGLAGYILRRLLFLPVILFVVSFGTFYLTRWGPGDPISVYSGQFRDPEAFERVREQYGLDEPVYKQYGLWLKGVITEGDFGPSYRYRDRDMMDVILPKMWVSVRVAVIAFVLTFLIGIPVGVYAAVSRGTWKDPTLIGFFLFFRSIPVLILVPLLVWIFAVRLGWLPAGGFDGFWSMSMVIPTIALTIGGIAGVARLSRTATLISLDEEFVRTARAKGLHEFTVISRHVMRTSVVPLMTTVVGLDLVFLIEGAFFIEILLGIPGIGSFAFDSVKSQDYNVVLALVLITTTAFVLANLLADIALAAIDPRVRAGMETGH